MNYIAPSIVGYIGFDLTIKCLTSITSSATNICSLLTYISTHTAHSDVIFEIKHMDLDTDIEGTTILLNELQHSLNEKNHTQSLAYHIKKLHNSINDIEMSLIDIHTKLGFNKSLMIGSGFRSYKLEGDIENLKALKKTFKERRMTLFEIIKINPHLKPYVPSQNENMEESIILL